ncbi:MAG: hypothetical protein OER95_09630 [Acidimicrobiia bacterium]|nr:hypothetical protein [Acidimicrobiia bacterium]
MTSDKDPVFSPRTDRFDPFLADVELRNAYRHLMDGDWRRLESFLDSSPKAWLFSSIITSHLVGIEPITFARWAELAGSPRARTYQAAVLIRDAFADRAAHEAELAAVAEGRKVSSQQQLEADGQRVLADYQDALNRAERELYDVVRERPSMSDPWVFLLISGRGLGVRLEELRQRFDNAHSRQPFRPDACREYLEGLMEKWGGSQDATFDFARWVEQEAPPDSPARMTLPVAHIEQGLLDGGGSNLAPYLNDEAVVTELVTALDSFLRAIPAPAPTESLLVLNAYALAVSADSPDTAYMMTDVFERIANRPTTYPWSLYKEQIPEVFNEIQADQLRFSSRY